MIYGIYMDYTKGSILSFLWNFPSIFSNWACRLKFPQTNQRLRDRQRQGERREDKKGLGVEKRKSEERLHINGCWNGSPKRWDR